MSHEISTSKPFSTNSVFRTTRPIPGSTIDTNPFALTLTSFNNSPAITVNPYSYLTKNLNYDSNLFVSNIGETQIIAADSKIYLETIFNSTGLPIATSIKIGGTWSGYPKNIGYLKQENLLSEKNNLQQTIINYTTTKSNIQKEEILATDPALNTKLAYKAYRITQITQQISDLQHTYNTFDKFLNNYPFKSKQLKNYTLIGYVVPDTNLALNGTNFTISNISYKLVQSLTNNLVITSIDDDGLPAAIALPYLVPIVNY